jgi:hypothetical protein
MRNASSAPNACVVNSNKAGPFSPTRYGVTMWKPRGIGSTAGFLLAVSPFVIAFIRRCISSTGISSVTVDTLHRYPKGS